MPVDQGSAFEHTLARIRERYALYFYLPDGALPAEASSVEVELSDAARRRYRGGGVGAVMRKAALVLAFAATLSAGDRRLPPWEKNHLRIGQALYRENCAVCHDIDRAQSKKFGPSFYQLFRRPQMPIAKVKPNREYIKLRIKFGGALMPSFRGWLSERDMDCVIDYIASQ